MTRQKKRRNDKRREAAELRNDKPKNGWSGLRGLGPGVVGSGAPGVAFGVFDGELRAAVGSVLEGRTTGAPAAIARGVGSLESGTTR